MKKYYHVVGIVIDVRLKKYVIELFIIMLCISIYPNCYRTSKMCNKAVDTSLFAIQSVLEHCKY